MTTFKNHFIMKIKKIYLNKKLRIWTDDRFLYLGIRIVIEKLNYRVIAWHTERTFQTFLNMEISIVAHQAYRKIKFIFYNHKGILLF